MDVKAHTSIVNAIDGCGGQAKGYGAPELVTSGRDGAVRVWDVRQRDAPVACFEPGDGVKARDCWSVVGAVRDGARLTHELERAHGFK